MWPSHGHPSFCSPLTYCHLTPSLSFLQSQATFLHHYSYCQSCFHLYPLIHCSCNLSYSALLKLLSCCTYALLHFPTISFSSPPLPPHTLVMYHWTLWSQYIPLQDGIHLILTYEYCFHIAFSIPTGIHSPFWYSCSLSHFSNRPSPSLFLISLLLTV